MNDTLDVLKQSSMFATLEDDELRTLGSLIESHQFKQGQQIFLRGDAGDYLYIVKEGVVEVFVESTDGTKIVFAEYRAGGVLGEITLLDGGPRTATAVALQDCELLKFDRADVLALVSKHPEAALDLLGAMGKKLRATNELLRNPITRNANDEVDETLTFGARIADRVAAFGGSWPFVLGFTSLLIGWMSVNTYLARQAFDPYPFVLLNLALSALAALQAPVIMMSQNRHSAKDRIRADLDYEVNLKAGLEIAHLHNKVDRLHEALSDHLARNSRPR
jgi:CRP/FNR family transcriptional regulator, cyclic AMP receptor protein